MLLNANHNDFKSSRTGSSHVSVSELEVLLTKWVLSPGTYLSVDVGDVVQLSCVLLPSQAVWQELMATVNNVNNHHACPTTVSPPGATTPKLLLTTDVTQNTERGSEDTITAEVNCCSASACSVPELVSSSLLYNAVSRAEFTVVWSRSNKNVEAHIS
jgi:hypothetical protein